MLRQRSAAARRRGPSERGSRSPLVAVLGGALCLATVGLLWLGYRATAEWNRSEVQLADKRASEKLALLIAALDRDMKGAQLSVLVPINQEQLAGGGPAGLSALFARAFARFPYPESFFVWSRPSPHQENALRGTRRARGRVGRRLVPSPVASAVTGPSYRRCRWPSALWRGESLANLWRIQAARSDKADSVDPGTRS